MDTIAPLLPRTDHMRDVQAVWRSLMRGADMNASHAVAEAAQWIVEARHLLASASERLDPVYQAQIRELMERCRP